VTKRLVVSHLEDVSGRLFEHYQPVIRDLIRGQSGIYALYRRGRLYYVGLATNLMSRMKAHLRDRHEGLWDRFSVYLTVHDEHLKELEALLLRIGSPSGNKQSGKFSRSQDLRKTLSRPMRESDADHRALLLGGATAARRRRQKAKAGKGRVALSKAFGEIRNLRATYKGVRYRGRLRRDGTISHGGEIYDSPSAAAKAVVG